MEEAAGMGDTKPTPCVLGVPTSGKEKLPGGRLMSIRKSLQSSSDFPGNCSFAFQLWPILEKQLVLNSERRFSPCSELVFVFEGN